MRARRDDVEWLAALPKVEIHLHLEGAIPLPALRTLLRKYGSGAEADDPDLLKRRFRFRSFRQFLEAWVWKNGFLRNYEDFEFISEETARELARQGVVYAEVFCSPADFSRHGLGCQRIVESIRRGLDAVDGIRVAIIVDLVRDFGEQRAHETLSEVGEVLDRGVVGVGIGGSEAYFPPGAFRDVYERAREMGLRTTAHAGEVSGAASIWGAIRELRVDRIGHGTRAFEDEALVDYLVESQIPLEMCPVSNVRTGVVARLADHPIKRYLEAGMCVTVNTDDPLMFGNRLDTEYALLMGELGLSRRQVVELLRNAIRATWLAPSDQRALMAGLDTALGSR